MMNRRTMLRGMLGTGLATGIGPGLGGLMLPNPAFASLSGATPKRVVFFLQNQGFDPKTCIPNGMVNGGSLAKEKLPEPIQALEPYKERLHIINGLHGVHTSPSHSAFFGALGGYRGGDGVPPSASTIDHEISKVLPETLLPHLCIGMDSIENMRTKPTVANLSASGAGQPIFMHSNPNHLFQMLYGGISTGQIRQQYEAQTNLLQKVEGMARTEGSLLPTADAQRYGQYVQCLTDVNALQGKLSKIADHLKQFAPKVDDRYTTPDYETDWHDALLELGISALTSGITNTLTIGSGRGEIFGAWKGLGIEQQGHNLGHMKQPDNPIWIKIRQYNCDMLVRIMEALESIPEGSGTMMDHTLIVYTSNNADKQHTNGANWPVMLLGDFDGSFKTGCFTQLQGKRPLNAFYATLLLAAGKKCDRFNMSEQLAKKYDNGTGPIKELLA